MTRGRYAVIPTRNRPAQLQRCVEAIRDQVDMILVVDNGSSPPASPGNACVIQRLMTQPPNISIMWNIGLRYFEQVALTRRLTEWDVAILNDDAVAPPGWFVVVSDAMRKYDALAGSSGGAGHTDPVLYGSEAPPAIHTRVQGWAFILRGESGLRADESFPWWCGDDDLSMQARRGGGVVIVPGLEVLNTMANSTTVGPLLDQSARDMAHFVEKWGQRPW